jgi:hypothetical protein
MLMTNPYSGTNNVNRISLYKGQRGTSHMLNSRITSKKKLVAELMKGTLEAGGTKCFKLKS